VFLLVRLNDILGMRIGFKAEIKSSLIHGEKSETDIFSDLKMQETIAELSKIFPTFNHQDFLEKAQKAFEIIFMAYAEEDKITLNNLLCQRIYSAFCMAIDDRKNKREKVEGLVVRFISVEIIDITINANDVFLDVKFVTEQSNVLKNHLGEIIDGNPDYVNVCTDVWCFNRKKISASPRWLLYEIKNQE
jgi:predicted lipid-binding transport protein (Tim44 family)